MSSSKTREAAEFLANIFENRLKSLNRTYVKKVHRTDGISFYFTRLLFVPEHDWTIRISDHEQQGDNRFKKNYYSIIYRDINKRIPHNKLDKSLEILIGS